MARILAYTLPAAGHLFPLVAGLRELQPGVMAHVRTLAGRSPQLPRPASRLIGRSADPDVEVPTTWPAPTGSGWSPGCAT